MPPSQCYQFVTRGGTLRCEQLKRFRVWLVHRMSTCSFEVLPFLIVVVKNCTLCFMWYTLPWNIFGTTRMNWVNLLYFMTCKLLVMNIMTYYLLYFILYLLTQNYKIMNRASIIKLWWHIICCTIWPACRVSWNDPDVLLDNKRRLIHPFLDLQKKLVPWKIRWVCVCSVDDSLLVSVS
jgi:hypothetical protein